MSNLECPIEIKSIIINYYYYYY